MSDVKVFADIDKVRDKVRDIRVKIGDWEDTVRIRFIRISELKNLEKLLRRAVEYGRTLPRHTGSLSENGLEGPIQQDGERSWQHTDSYSQPSTDGESIGQDMPSVGEGTRT